MIRMQNSSNSNVRRRHTFPPFSFRINPSKFPRETFHPSPRKGGLKQNKTKGKRAILVNLVKNISRKNMLKLICSGVNPTGAIPIFVLAWTGVLLRAISLYHPEWSGYSRNHAETRCSCTIFWAVWETSAWIATHSFLSREGKNALLEKIIFFLLLEALFRTVPYLIRRWQIDRRSFRIWNKGSSGNNYTIFSRSQYIVEKINLIFERRKSRWKQFRKDRTVWKVNGEGKV